MVTRHVDQLATAPHAAFRFRYHNLSSGSPDSKIHRPISSKTKLREIFVGDVNVPSQRLRVTIVSVGMMPKSTVEISHRLLMAVGPPQRWGRSSAGGSALEPPETTAAAGSIDTRTTVELRRIAATPMTVVWFKKIKIATSI